MPASLLAVIYCLLVEGTGWEVRLHRRDSSQVPSGWRQKIILRAITNKLTRCFSSLCRLTETEFFVFSVAFFSSDFLANWFNPVFHIVQSTKKTQERIKVAIPRRSERRFQWNNEVNIFRVILWKRQKRSSNDWVILSSVDFKKSAWVTSWVFDWWSWVEKKPPRQKCWAENSWTRLVYCHSLYLSLARDNSSDKCSNCFLIQNKLRRYEKKVCTFPLSFRSAFYMLIQCHLPVIF